MAAVLHPGVSQIPLHVTESLVTPAGAHQCLSSLGLVTHGWYLGFAVGQRLTELGILCHNAEVIQQCLTAVQFLRRWGTVLLCSMAMWASSGWHCGRC